MPGTASPFESFGRRVDEHLNNAAPRFEEEFRKVISYLNDDVVPLVRSNCSQALRVTAEQLGKLAAHLDKGANTSRTTGPQP